MNAGERSIKLLLFRSLGSHRMIVKMPTIARDGQQTCVRRSAAGSTWRGIRFFGLADHAQSVRAARSSAEAHSGRVIMIARLIATIILLLLAFVAFWGDAL